MIKKWKLLQQCIQNSFNNIVDIEVKLLFLLILLVSYNCFGTTVSSKFVLITVLYNEQHPKRIKEYLSCLKCNRKHPSIELVHVVYDTSKDTEKTVIADYLRDNRICVTRVPERPTYGHCFQLANSIYPDRKIIVSNADIFFNHTLSLLDSYDLTNKFLALTRWNVLKGGELKIFKQYKGNGIFNKLETSQDAWIFQTPLRAFKNDAIKIGTPQCDSLIAYQAFQAGLEVLNPCLSIQACHLHRSQIRNYSLKDRITTYNIMRSVPWVTLK